MACSVTLVGRLDLDVTVFAIATYTVHLQDQYTANTLHHSFYYRRIGKWDHFLFFNKIKIIISKSCLLCIYAMDKLKGYNQIFLTEVEHQSDGKMLCKSEGR